MSVVKRFNELLDLDEIDVFIDEVDKSNHIILSDVPDSLPQGRSSFLIEASPYIREDTEFQIDFIDAEGASIYTEPIADYLEGRARRISVEVYDDTAPGIATLIIVGELVAVPDGNTIFSDAEPVPSRFQGAYNVRLIKQIVINPTATNTQPIKFFGQPKIKVEELRLGTMIRTDVTGSITSSFFELEGIPTDESNLFKPLGTNINPNQGLLSENAPSSPAKQRSIEAYIESRKRKNRKGKRKNSLFKRSGLLSKTNSPPSFPYRIRPASFNNETFRFNTRFIGGTIQFHTSSLGNTFGNSSFYPQDALTQAGLIETPTFDTEKEQGVVNTSASMYTASIVDLVSDRIIAVDKPFTNKNVNGEDVILPIFAKGQIHYEAMPTASYANANLISYANVTLSDMRTFSGDVYKVKVYVKSEGGFDDYKLLAEVPLEGKELLVDDASVGQGDRTGYFIEQSDVHNFWTVSGSVNGESPLPTSASNAAYKNNVMLDSVQLSGSLTTPTNHLKFQLKDQYSFELIKGIDYNFSADIIGDSSKSNYATLAIYISGSSMNQSDELFFDEHTNTEVLESSKYGKRLGTLTVSPNEDNVKNFETVTQTFTPDRTGNAVLQIRVLSGIWNISDIAIGPASDTGFNPSLFQFKQEMPAELSHKRPDTFEFMTEFYDVNNNLSDTIAYKSNVRFTGTNMTITGEDNVLESNMFIGGDTTASGMHLGGVSSTLPETGGAGAQGSGFMRSVGYEGFTSASDPALGGRFGFMIYSGSVLPDSGENYLGVGLELVGQNGSLKFRTNPSVFDVQADAFFVGNKNLQFISGSNQNIEISSSGIHVTPEGNVTASAILLGDKGGGQFLQFDNGQLTVQGNLSVDQIFTPATIAGNPSNVTNASSSITAEGFANFVSASIAGFTVNPIAIHSGDNNLVMSASGQITGSTVLFTGGKIASFNLSNDAFTAGETFFISSSVTDTNGFFISSSNFNVKAGGDITGSQVLFTGGTIGGFNLNEQQITGGNLVLDKSGFIKSSNYQSDVAGFKITAEDNGFAEFENVRIRGTLATTTFEKESVNAVGGQLFVANSTALTGSAILASATTMSVVNASGFEHGEILVAKKITNTGFNTEYIKVNSASLDGDLSKDEVYGRIYVTRSISDTASENSSSIGDPIGTAQDYEPGQVLVSSGKIGTGYIRLNANPNNLATPYIDIIERTGTDVYDVELKTRLGDLSGVAGTRNVPSNFTGFGLMTEVAFLSGSNIKLEAPSFLLGDLNANFISGSNSNIEISSSKFHIKQDGDVIVRKIDAEEGSIGGFTINTTGGGQLRSPSGNFIVSGSAGIIELGGGVGDAANRLIKLDARSVVGGKSGNEVVRLSIGNENPLSAPFQVNAAGAMTSSAAQIIGSNIEIDTPNFTLTTAGNVSANNMALNGDIIFTNSSGVRAAEVGNITLDGSDVPGIDVGRGHPNASAGVGIFRSSQNYEQVLIEGASTFEGAPTTPQITMGLITVSKKNAILRYDHASNSNGFEIFTAQEGELHDRKNETNNFVRIQPNMSGSVTILEGGVQGSGNKAAFVVGATMASANTFIDLGNNIYFGLNTYINSDLTVNGNISTSGTVDGTDVAALNTTVSDNVNQNVKIGSTPSFASITTTAQPAFLAYLHADQTFDQNNHNTVEFAHTRYNIGSDFDTSTYTFTAPADGRYLFYAKIQLSSNDGALSNSHKYQARIVGGGADAVLSNDIHDTANSVGANIAGSVVFDLDANNTVRVTIKVANGAGNNSTIDGSNSVNISYFGGYKLS